MNALGPSFRTASVTYLRDTYLPRIEKALETLPADDLWWRPHEDCTSVGNLLAHLAGNVRQWIVSGLGGAADHRARLREFEADREDSVSGLVTALRAAVGEACEVISGLSDDDLMAPRTIQGMETTGFDAIYHVVEHFSWHTGQITWMAKLRAGAGHGMFFYDEDQLNSARNT